MSSPFFQLLLVAAGHHVEIGSRENQDQGEADARQSSSLWKIGEDKQQERGQDLQGVMVHPGSKTWYVDFSVYV